MKDNKSNSAPDLFRRNNEAPDLTGTLVRNRTQFMVEKYLQNFNVPIENFIANNQYLDLKIPVEIIRSWYPSPSWKKDLEIMCDKLLNKRVSIKSENGNFRSYNLLSYAALTSDGLELHIEPSALKIYLLDNEVARTDVDYNASNFFESKFSHQIYWECLKHANAASGYQFKITPERIHTLFGNKYTANTIVIKILEPVRREFEDLYKRGILMLSFTYKDVRLPKAKTTYIDHWIIEIHSREREKRGSQQMEEWIKDIEAFIQSYLPLKKDIIMPQVSRMEFAILGKLYARICKMRNGELEKKDKPYNYICQVLMSEEYNINPNKLPHEDDYFKPLRKQNENQNNIISTGAGTTEYMRFLELAKDVLQDCYFETQDEKRYNMYDVWVKPLEFVQFENNILTLKANKVICEYVEEHLIDKLKPLFDKAFGDNIQLLYKTL